jgi:hypothetical protein
MPPGIVWGGFVRGSVGHHVFIYFVLSFFLCFCVTSSALKRIGAGVPRPYPGGGDAAEGGSEGGGGGSAVGLDRAVGHAPGFDPAAAFQPLHFFFLSFFLCFFFTPSAMLNEENWRRCTTTSSRWW